MRRFSWIPALRWIVLLPSYSVVLLVRLLKWLVAPAALLLQLAIGVPLGLLRVRLPLRPRFTPVAEQDLPDAAWIALSEATDSLAPEGFTPRGDFRCDELLRGGVIWLRYLEHPSSGVQALAAQLTLKIKVRPLRRFVEFTTEFGDSRTLVTTNRDLPYSLPPPAYLARIELKDVWEPRALYGLHRDLVASLGQSRDAPPFETAGRDPAAVLADRHARQVRLLVERGWLRWDSEPHSVRLRPLAALASVWRQAWPLRGVYLRAAGQRSRRLLLQHGLEVKALTGSASTITVCRQPLPNPAALDGVRASYEHVQRLARQTDPGAILETVTVALKDNGPDNAILFKEFRYSFRSHEDCAERQIRRLCSFDIVLDPAAESLSVTAAEREFDQAANADEWTTLAARAPLEPLAFDPWMRDLDTVLPAARATFARAASNQATLDSASLYLENRRLCWQVVAWTDDDQPLFVVLDARSGAVLNP
ncbi:MAG TPA: hypothetical protein PLP22_00805 [Candidatus Competibacter sp.]|nr:hypothetical protein [Candidatus Competibacter sp.]HUM95229.1 hypothetical protein [Candidatus Competibacter sp.]